MHFWVIYQPGAGGHGFANCLEHANNVTPIDHQTQWRIHYRPDRFGILDRPIKFYPGDDTVDPELVNLAKGSQVHTVLSDHPWLSNNSLKEIKFDRVQYLSKFSHNVLIHLYSTNSLRVLNDFNAKMSEKVPDSYKNNYTIVKNKMLNMSEFAVHIDIDLAWRDWSYLSQSLNVLGIDLDKKYYDQYLTYIDL
jgi:hypothetical protein